MHHPAAIVAVAGVGVGAGLVALGVGGVLEGHPAVAGLGQGPHHAGVEVAGRDLALEAPVRFGLLVYGPELVAVGVGQLGHLLGVEKAPLPVLLHPLHEQVGHPVGEIDVVGATGVVAGVVAQFEELLDIRVPGLQVDARRALAPSALVDGGHRGVEGLQPRDDAVGEPVGAPDQRSLGADAVPAHADAARVLGEPGDVGVALVDAIEGVLGRVEQVAARHLRVHGARVEQRRARRQVGQRRDQVVEVDGLLRVGAQPAGHPQEEVLRGLDHQAVVGVAQQVAVVHGAQTEELEVAVAAGVDGGVEGGRVGLHERGGVVADQSQTVAGAHRLGEPRDVLVADLLVDVGGQHAGRQLRVVGLLHDQAGGGADAQLVELAGGGSVGEGRDGAGAHGQGIDAEQALRGPGHRVDDLVHVDRLEVAVALAHAHGRWHGGGRRRIGDGGQPVLDHRHVGAPPLTGSSVFSVCREFPMRSGHNFGT